MSIPRALTWRPWGFESNWTRDRHFPATGSSVPVFAATGAEEPVAGPMSYLPRCAMNVDVQSLRLAGT